MHIALQRNYVIAVPIIRRCFRRALIVLFLIGLVACIAIPYPKGPKIEDAQLVAIKKGISTQNDIRAALGEPTIIWETERVWVYEAGPSGGILWIGFGVDHTYLPDHVVIMRFDEDGRIQRLDQRVAPLNQSNYGEFLREWLAEQREKPVFKGKP